MLGEALAGGDVRRLFVIEAEYSPAMLRAEREWVATVVGGINEGRIEVGRSSRGGERMTGVLRRGGVSRSASVSALGGAYDGAPERPDRINETPRLRALLSEAGRARFGDAD